jgi:hypothetical protein
MRLDGGAIAAFGGDHERGPEKPILRDQGLRPWTPEVKR